ncbi:MAG: RDD family protein [Acidimicrobiales bacterium]
MDCSNCGTTMTKTTCPGCERSLPSNAHGRIDAVTGLMLAGWGRRAGQAFADGLVLVIPCWFVYSLFVELDGPTIGVAMMLVAAGAYLVRLWTASGGQTVGNRVAVTRVRSAATGHTITFAQAFRRWAFVAVYCALTLAPAPFGGIIFYVMLLADCLYPLLDSRNQTLHDKFAGTIVVVA